MRLHIEAQAPQLSYEDRELYKQHLRIINKILCSYSRYDAFVAAVADIAAAERYTVVADKCIGHNMAILIDEEGFVTTLRFENEGD